MGNEPSTKRKFSVIRLAEVFRQIDFTPREEYGPHRHHRLEINYVKRGSCSLLIEGDRCVDFRKDDLMLIPSGLSHTFVAGVRGTRLIQLEFMPELFDDVVCESDQVTDLTFSSRGLLAVRNNVRIRSLLQTIIWELQHEEDNYETMVMAGYKQLLILLLRETRTAGLSSSFPPPLAEMLRLLSMPENYRKTVGDLAAEMNLSTRYVHKLFTKYLGISPSRYLVNRRIERVKDLLVNTDMTLEEISDICGFSSARHLSACFNRVTGRRPSKHL